MSSAWGFLFHPCHIVLYLRGMVAAVKKGLIVKAVIIGSLAIMIYLLMIFAGYPRLVERYYSEGLYPAVCFILHPFFNIFPFSVGDILYLLVIAYLIYVVVTLVKLLLKGRFADAFTRLLAITIRILAAVLIFYLFWGMNYFRPSAGERLDLKDTTFSTAALKAVTEMLIDSANTTRARLTQADLLQNNGTIYHTAEEAIRKLSADSEKFRTFHPGVKPSLLSPLLNYFGTSGYMNPFTGEAQINYMIPVFTRPVTACHELSHQMGYGPEDEANFIGFLAGVNSKDRLLQYSAYYLAVGEFMRTLYFRDSLVNKSLRPRISPEVHHDFAKERAYWVSYQSIAETISGIFYDHFLKANNQPQGIDTYNRMILLVMAKYSKSVLPDSSIKANVGRDQRTTP
ncbi:MAG TPA: DUF3810 domain-containing protein [Mucilaginibacter sp.]|nr:DUF3810 domain-containing protein [Mucilaginibacter sp.]